MKIIAPMKVACILLVAICSVLVVFAQSSFNGKISGKVSLENNLPATKATIELHRGRDSSIVKLSLPEDNGSFQFDNLRPGSYFVTVTYSGYKRYSSSSVTLNGDKRSAEISAIQLVQGRNELGEVKVETKKPFIERKADRLIVNVENSIASVGSSAFEVLQRSPGVIANEEIGINLKGKSGVTIMLDGKVTPLSGLDLITYLKSVPAANLERIEIITNPSAKYDAEGNAGIIDIRFKKDQRQGYNGSIGASYGQGVYPKPGVNGSVNYRNKKWNLFDNTAVSEPNSLSNFYINRKFYSGGSGPLESIFDQTSFTKQPQQAFNMKTGVDFYASKKTVIGAMFNGTYYKGNRDGLSNAVITQPDGSLSYTNLTDNLLKDRRHNLFGNLNFKRTFDSAGTELNADLDVGTFHARPLQDILAKTFDQNHNLTDDEAQKSDQQSAIRVRSFKADYVHPLKNEGKLEVGIKTSAVTTDNDVKFFNVVNGTGVLDASRSNHFIYTENVNAAYVNYSKHHKSTDLQLGLRLEQTHSKGNQVATSESLNRNYAQLFPSFSVDQKLSEKNDVSFSYSRRIDRPSYRDLNPFKILVDNYTYVLGDPYLRPVLTNSLQLGYTFAGKYNATLSYVQSKDVITDVFIQDDNTKISSQIPANLRTYHQYDLSVNVPVTIKTWLSTNIDGSMSYDKYNSPLQGGDLSNQFLMWNMNMTNNFVIGKKGWSAELSGFYQSKMPWGLFIIRNLAQVSSGIQKLSANKKSVYKIAVADIFSTNHIAVLVKYQNQDWHTDRTWDSRYVTFSYTYRFGKASVARARQRSSGIEDEKRRAG